LSEYLCGHEVHDFDIFRLYKTNFVERKQNFSVVLDNRNLIDCLQNGQVVTIGMFAIFRKAPPSVVSGYGKRSINLNKVVANFTFLEGHSH
jgi:hypothetical protein